MSEPSPERGRVSRIPTVAPSSPKRTPLAQRSDSEANTSTIRLVSDDTANVYLKSPFPSLPSQILPPRKLSPIRYAPFVSKDGHVSDENNPTNRPLSRNSKRDALVPKPLELRRTNRASSATITSDNDSSILTTSTLTTNDTLTSPLSSRQSSRTTPPSSPIDDDFEGGSSRLEPVHEENLETDFESPRHRKSNPGNHSTIRAVSPSISNDRLPLRVQDSKTSLVSSNSSSTLPGRPCDDHEITSSIRNFEVYPHSSSGHYNPPSSTGNFETYPHSSAADLGVHPYSSTGNLEVEPYSSTGNFEVYPHSSSHISLLPERGRHLEASPALSVQTKPITNYASVESLLLPDVDYPSNADRPRSASSPTRPASHASFSSPPHPIRTISYPVVRPPSASGWWVEVSEPHPDTKPPRMSDEPFRTLPWSPRLSTIASESDRSNSQSTSTENPRNGRRRRTFGSLTSGDHLNSLSDERSSEFEYGSGVLTGSESNISIPIPLPLYSPRPLPTLPDEAHIRGRDSDERDDIVGELQGPPLRQQRSGLLTRYSSKSSLRPRSSDSIKSQISFVGELFWARRYYSNGEPVNMIARNASFVSDTSSARRMDTATSGRTASPVSDTVPSNLWRPRNRPREGGEQDQPKRRLRPETRRIYKSNGFRHTSAITEETELSDSSGRGRRRHSLSTPELSVNEMMYSPHLRRDRRQTARYSAWAAPSFEEPFGKSMFGPTNRQIVCFAVGFLFPIAWMIAAFLALPQRPSPDNAPATSESADYNNATHASSGDVSDYSFEEKRWQKAHWWRRINRILSVVGLLIIGAIIALAVVGTRKSSGNPQRTPVSLPVLPN